LLFDGRSFGLGHAVVTTSAPRSPDLLLARAGARRQRFLP